jgi:hypothetical protein
VSTPEDRVEQETPVVREPDAQVDVPLEADAADAAEQSAVVELDEDEHR